MAWTDERIALLKRYWEEGCSASQIAELLGEGLSRNAVIGKAHRLGLAARPSPLKTADGKGEPRAAAAADRPAPRPRPIARPADGTAPAAGTPPPSAPARTPSPVAAAPAAPAAAPVATPMPGARTPAGARPKGARVTLLDLNDRICKWPIGHPDEPDFHFCGKPVSPGFPYCAEHCLIAYQAQQPRRDRPPGSPPPRPFGPNLPRPR